MTEMT